VAFADKGTALLSEWQTTMQDTVRGGQEREDTADWSNSEQ